MNNQFKIGDFVSAVRGDARIQGQVTEIDDRFNIVEVCGCKFFADNVEQLDLGL